MKRTNDYIRFFPYWNGRAVERTIWLNDGGEEIVKYEGRTIKVREFRNEMGKYVYFTVIRVPKEN